MSKILQDQIQYIKDKVEDVSDIVHKIDKDLAVHKNAFDEHLKQDEKMYQEFKRLNDILQQNTESLKEHIYRTELAEKQLVILENLAKNIDSRLSPIETEKIKKQAILKYRNQILVRLAKILGIVTALIGIISGIKTFLL